MRVVVFGASGNVGTSVVRALRSDRRVDEIIGVQRRAPAPGTLDIEWAAADIGRDDLVPLVEHADAVVHLAWAVQPQRDRLRLHETNVIGSARIFEAVGRAEVPALVYASSLGAYSSAPLGAVVDESHPTDGIPTSTYSLQKAYVERLLDRFEAAHGLVRTVRLRPALCLKGEAAEEVRGLFGGPAGRFLPAAARRLRHVRLMPDVDGLAVQVVHTDDVADAYRRAVTGSVKGAFNVAAHPILDAEVLSRTTGAWRVPVPARLVRSAMRVAYDLHLQPSEPGWFDMAAQGPLMSTERAERSLGWQATRSSLDTLRELIDGIAARSDLATPPLSGPG
ncbi:MAG TPA: NAD-dependent epimerase/dehydratase family protein [Acidimicrobiales bacterium]|jgi:nucleoside-diphosphate-sugar epimerase